MADRSKDRGKAPENEEGGATVDIKDVPEPKGPKLNIITDLNTLEGTELLGRDDILGAQDIRYAMIDVSEWSKKPGTKAHVLVRSITALERDRLEKSMLKGKGKNAEMNFEHFRAKLCVQGIVNSKGERLFTPEDIEALSAKSSAPVTRCSDAITKLSGITKEDVDEIVGNSESEAGVDSSSASL